MAKNSKARKAWRRDRVVTMVTYRVVVAPMITAYYAAKFQGDDAAQKRIGENLDLLNDAYRDRLNDAYIYFR